MKMRPSGKKRSSFKKLKMRIDRNALSVVSRQSASDREYWLSVSPMERLQAIQINRQAAFGESNASGRLQRILEIAKRP